MSLSRKFLSALGIEDEKAQQIIEAHMETVNGLKDRLEAAEAGSKDTEALQKQLEQAQKDLEAAKKSDWQGKYEALKKDFDSYKGEQTAKETRAAKEKAGRAYLEANGIKGENADIAMRGMSAEIDAMELDGDKIKDTSAIDALIAGVYKGLKPTTETKGAQTATPPASNPQKVYTAKEISLMTPAQINEHWDEIKPSLKGAK